VLRVRPLRELATLRHDPTCAADVAVAAGVPKMLDCDPGEAFELEVRFQPGQAGEFGVAVRCDAAGGNGLPVTVDPGAAVLRVGAVTAPCTLPAGEAAVLRVFVDKNVIEVFAGDRQAAVTSHRAAGGNRGVCLLSRRGAAAAAVVQCWRMRSIYQDPPG
jgi:beta-fructofuranosidase